jgi:hypothetical protein
MKSSAGKHDKPEEITMKPERSLIRAGLLLLFLSPLAVDAQEGKGGPKARARIRDDTEMLRLSGDSVTDELLVNNVGKLKKLRELTLFKTNRVTDRGLIDGVAKLGQLESLDVEQCQGLTDRALIEGVSQMTNLRELVINNAGGFTEQGVVEGIGNLADLKRLELSDPRSMLTDRSVIEGIARLSNLRFLGLTNAHSDEARLTDEGVIKGIARLRMLNTLAFNGRDITDEALVNGISKIENLRSLHMGLGYRLTDRGWKALTSLEDFRDLALGFCTNTPSGETLAKFENLRGFRCWGCDFNDDDLLTGFAGKELENLVFGEIALSYLSERSLMQIWPKQRKQERYYLAGLQVTDEIVPVLSKQKNVKALWLMYTGLSDKGVEELCSNLEGLDCLGLNGLAIGDDVLLRILSKQNRITRLWLRDTLVTDACFEKMKEMLPEMLHLELANSTRLKHVTQGVPDPPPLGMTRAAEHYRPRQPNGGIGPPFPEYLRDTIYYWKARYITGKSCESCLALMDPRSPFRYCPKCSDWDGRLYPREIVRKNIAIWMQAWQEDISYDQAVKRAGYFMSAMPAWADPQVPGAADAT